MKRKAQCTCIGWLQRGWLAVPLTLIGLAWPAQSLAQSPPAAAAANPQDDLSDATRAKLALINPAARGEQDAPEGPATCSGSANTLLYPLNQGTWTIVDFFGNGATGSGPATGPTQLGQRNDDDSASIPSLGFIFDLYGDTYSSCFVNNNGNISFVSLFSTFSSVAFPSSSFRMVAPFWGDVDTRTNAGLPGDVYQRFVDSNGDSLIDTFVVTWDNVGYYNQQQNLRNTFQVAISDGNNPLMGIGNNVCFSYDNMCWTTGSASGGVGGFGGTPATVGANRGNGAQFFQFGRFNMNNASYDGPGGANDGVDFLDGQHFCFSTAVINNNICPIAVNFPAGNQVSVTVPATLNLNLGFISPEAGQTTAVTFTDPNGAQANGLVITTTSGNPANINLNWPTGCSDAGTYVINFFATDNFVPPCTSTASLTIIVLCPNQPPVCNADGPYSAECAGATTSLALNGSGSSDPDGDPLTYTWTTDCPGGSFNNASSVTPTLTLSSGSCSTTCTVTLEVSDGTASATCTASVTVTDTTPPSITCPPDAQLQCGDSTDPSNTGSATSSDACGTVSVSIYSGTTQGGGTFNTGTTGGGAPYTGLVGSFTAPDVMFRTSTGFAWHPFGLFSFGADITGCLNVASAGTYSFTLTSDDGSLLFIDGNLVVDDGNAHTPASASGSAALTAGTHTFEVQFFECCGGPSGVDLFLPAGVSYGGCATVSHSDAATAANCTGQAGIDRTWTATDACGNTATCVQHITFVDTTPPTISCPPDVTATCGSVGDTGMATATDNCDTTPTVSFSDSVSTPSCLADPVQQTISRTWTATDDCGNSSTCVQTITILKVVGYLDIKPGSCPNAYNPNKKGVLPLALVGTAGFNVSNVDASSLRISRADCVGGSVAPLQNNFQDAAQPFSGTLCNCHTLTGDGIQDLWMKFDAVAVSSALQLTGLPGGTSVELVITGTLMNGCSFAAHDCIVITAVGAAP